MYELSNPHNVDTSKPFIYLVQIEVGARSFRYIGKASKKSRLTEYTRNVEKILAGQARRPAIKKNGEPQSNNNLKYRFVHLVLALAVKNRWKIEHYPIENSNKERLSEREKTLTVELKCNLNNRERWVIDDFEELATKFLQENS